MRATFPITRPTNKPQTGAGDVAGYYQGLPASTAVALRDAAEQIRDLKKRVAGDMLRMGKLLLQSRAMLRPAAYNAWVASELGWGASTARNMCLAAEKFGDLAPETSARLEVTALFELARHRAPEAARKEAIERARGGAVVTRAAALELVDKHRTPGGDAPSQTELAAFYRFRSSLRALLKAWDGEPQELGRRVLEVVRDVLAGGNELDGAMTEDLDQTALALGVPMLN